MRFLCHRGKSLKSMRKPFPFEKRQLTGNCSIVLLASIKQVIWALQFLFGIPIMPTIDKYGNSNPCLKHTDALAIIEALSTKDKVPKLSDFACGYKSLDK